MDGPSHKAPAEEPFVLAAMLSLLAAAIWMALRPALLLGFFYSPENLALTHLVTLGFLTAVTDRVGLETGIVVLPQRQPVVVAKEAATVDYLSGGRLRLGIGIGWQVLGHGHLDVRGDALVVDPRLVRGEPAGDRQPERAALAGQLLPLLDRALAETGLADQRRAVVVLERTGHDLAGRRAALVDQHDELDRRISGDPAGHGIGLEPVEAPFINAGSDDVFAAGDTITLEPGLYGGDLRAGVRLEQDYVVEADGLRRLSTLPLDLPVGDQESES